VSRREPSIRCPRRHRGADLRRERRSVADSRLRQRPGPGFRAALPPLLLLRVLFAVGVFASNSAAWEDLTSAFLGPSSSLPSPLRQPRPLCLAVPRSSPSSAPFSPSSAKTSGPRDPPPQRVPQDAIIPFRDNSTVSEGGAEGDSCRQ
jgi:hypothetical protein